MMLEEISKISCIICSKPAKPAVEDFKSGAFHFNDRLVVAVIASGMAAEEIEEELKMALSEISSIQIEAYTPGSITAAAPDTPDGNTDMSAIIDGIIGCDEDPDMPQTEKIGEIMARAGYIKQDEIEEILKKQQEDSLNLKFGQIAIRENKADIKDVAHALKIQEASRSEMKSQAYIRIPAYKADNLVDLLGELLITQSLHKQDVSDLLGKDNKIANNILRMERIAKDIQDISMSLRMVSLKQTFQKLYRVGRDTSLELKKTSI